MALSRGPKIVTDGLVLCLDAADSKSYSGSGDIWYDRSGEGNNGTLYNEPTFDSANGGVMDFDGVDDSIGLAFIQNTGGSFSVEVWAKCESMTTDSSNRQVIFSFNTGTYGYQLLDLEVWGDVPRSFNGNGSSYALVAQFGSQREDTNNWHCYTFSSNSGVWSWYLDGVLGGGYGTAPYTPTYTTTSVNFRLASRGSGISGNSQNWDGKISSARVYNRALTAAQVLQNFNAMKSRFGI